MMVKKVKNTQEFLKNNKFSDTAWIQHNFLHQKQRSIYSKNAIFGETPELQKKQNVTQDCQQNLFQFGGQIK